MSHGPNLEGGKAEPNLIPLLDVVFQLIMFFLITINLVTSDKFSEKVKLPVAQAAVPLKSSANAFVILQLNKQGKLIGSIENYKTDSPQKLKVYLQRQKKVFEDEARDQGHKEPNIVVVLRADKHTRYRDVWEVL